MIKKPGVPLLFCLIVFLTIGFPSCERPDYMALRDIDRVEIFDRASSLFIYAPATTSSDSISLIIFNKVVSFSSHFSTGLMQSAWATSPSRPQLANEIVDIRIYCDLPLFGIAAGENLAPELLFGFYWSEGMPLADFLEEAPAKGEVYEGGLEDITVYFDTKPQPGTYQFTIEIEDNNGHVFSGNPPSLTWL